MDQEDPERARAVALGRRNAEVIELFERFCRNVRVEVTGGTGTIELDTGLPIGQRSFRCKYASGTMSSGSNLEYEAVGFYEEHCRECADRVRPGLLGGISPRWLMSGGLLTGRAPLRQPPRRRRG